MSKKNKRIKKNKEENIMENNMEELNQNIEETNAEEQNEQEDKTDEEVIENQQQVNNTILTNEQEDKTDEEVIENQQQVDEIIEEPELTNEQEDKTDEEAEVLGSIINYDKIYVRSKAEKDSEPVGIVTKEDTIAIDMEMSTNDFYKVYTSNGLEGYCVKNCIKIN